MASKKSTSPAATPRAAETWRSRYWFFNRTSGRAGIEFGAAQRVDATESAGELCGPMLVFQDAIPYSSVESPGIE
jgi:hypothetical protein